MIDIYQQIWDTDQASAGVQPILDTMIGDSQTGYVKINSNLNETNRNLCVLPEAVIPESKKLIYDLCRRLFDNYALSERYLNGMKSLKPLKSEKKCTTLSRQWLILNR